MREEWNKYELFENFLNGSLNQQEENLFRERLETDRDLNEEFQIHKQMFSILTDSGLLELKNDIAKIHTQKLNLVRNAKIIGISTIIAIIGVIATITLNRSENDKVLPQNENVIDTTTMHSAVAPAITTKENKSQIARSPKIISTTKNEKTEKNEDSLSLSVRDIAEKKLTPQKEIIARPTTMSKNVTIIEQNESQHIYDSANAENITDKKDPCAGVEIYARIETKPSCNNQATGSIIFDNGTFSGGDGPYSFSIDNGKNYYAEPNFLKLTAGRYDLIIKDKNNCAGKLGMYMVESIKCTKDYAFTPSAGETWEVPSQEKNGTLYIYTKIGQLVYKRDIEEFETFEWNGNRQNGGLLPMGLYRFLFKSTDGMEFMGSVTILR